MKNILFKDYITSFEAFGRYSEEYGYQLEHLVDLGDSYLQDGFSVLDIGAGTGFFSEEFFENCKADPGFYKAIEPSPDHVLKLEDNFKKFNMEVEILQEIFTPKTDFKEKFDLIIMSHSLYWFVPQAQEYILNALNFLKTKGKLVMYLQTPFSVSHLLNLLFEKYLSPERVPNHRITSWSIIDLLNVNKIDYQVTNLPGTFNATHLFRENDVKLLHQVIAFFLSTQVETMPPYLLKRAENALRKFSFKEGGDIKLSLEVGAITASLK